MIFYFLTAFFVYTFHSPISRPVPCGAVVAEIWLRAMEPRPPTVIRGRSADNRKAPLNFSFPLEGKCHVVAKGCTRVSIPMKLTIVLLGPTLADSRILCRIRAVRIVSERSAGKYQSAGSVLQVPGPCMNSNDVILATHRDSSLRSE